MDSLQLVLLCKQKLVTASTMRVVFRPLIQDLHILETTGIDLGFEMNVYGSILCVTGDNLGSNWIGGFFTNFGNSEYLCRFCTIKRAEFVENALTERPLRTREMYDADAVVGEASGHSHIGVKFSSPLNELSYFHVCQPGLPPCIAHDIFEGVIAFDLILFIKHYISKRWFSLEYLNNRISKFPYNAEERMCKPCLIKKFTKLSGNASQNWCMLRLFPLFVMNKILDCDDPSWLVLLTLHEIVQLLCAPALNIESICFLNLRIKEYLRLRQTLFPDTPLRPKHHYLFHYPFFVLQYGPLSRAWTLRFESKHRYFKRVVRSSCNFVNITRTLTHHHQMLQSHMLESGMFADVKKLLLPVSAKFSSKILDCLKIRNFDIAQCMCYRKVSFKGTIYRCGSYVVLEKCHSDLLVGKIHAIIDHCNTVSFVVEKFLAEFIPNLNCYYVVKPSSLEYICCALDNIYDYSPLYGYDNHGCTILNLKHYLL